MSFKLGLSRDKHNYIIRIALLSNYSNDVSRKFVSDYFYREVRFDQEIDYLVEGVAEHFQVVLVFLSRQYRIDSDTFKGNRTEKLNQNYNKDLESYLHSLRELAKL